MEPRMMLGIAHLNPRSRWSITVSGVRPSSSNICSADRSSFVRTAPVINEAMPIFKIVDKARNIFRRQNSSQLGLNVEDSAQNAKSEGLLDACEVTLPGYEAAGLPDPFHRNQWRLKGAADEEPLRLLPIADYLKGAQRKVSLA